MAPTSGVISNLLLTDMPVPCLWGGASRCCVCCPCWACWICALSTRALRSSSVSGLAAGRRGEAGLEVRAGGVRGGSGRDEVAVVLVAFAGTTGTAGALPLRDDDAFGVAWLLDSARGGMLDGLALPRRRGGEDEPALDGRPPDGEDRPLAGDRGDEGTLLLLRGRRGDCDASELEERGIGDELPLLKFRGEDGSLLLLPLLLFLRDRREVPGALSGPGETTEESEVRSEEADAHRVVALLLWRDRRGDGDESEVAEARGDVSGESESRDDAPDEPMARGDRAEELDACGDELETRDSGRFFPLWELRLLVGCCCSLGGSLPRGSSSELEVC